jgi:hypothetical protein
VATPCKLNKSLRFLDLLLCLSFFSATGKEARATTNFIAPQCNNRGGKAVGPCRLYKMHSKHEFMHHPNSSHDAPSTLWDTRTVSKMDPTIVKGATMLRVLRRNSLVGLESLRATRARDEVTQSVASIWPIWGPIEGIRHPQASYLSPNREVSFTPLRVGWHLAIRIFPPGITQERRLKPL